MKGNVKWWQYYYPLIGGHRKDGYKNQDTLTNYGIAGATIEQIVEKSPEKSSMAKLVLGETGDSAINQALAQQPTFLSIWVGHNDILKAVTRTNTALMTSTEAFTDSLEKMAAKIKQTPSVQGVVIANIVDLTALPYLTDVNSAAHPQNSKRSFLLSSENQLSADQVLDPTELKQIQQQIIAYNQALKTIAKDNNWAYVDLHAFFAKINQEDYQLKDSKGFSTNTTINSGYLGGLVSLDGMHITSTGQAIFANRFIYAINLQYQTNLTHVDEVAASKKDTLFSNPVDPRTK